MTMQTCTMYLFMEENYQEDPDGEWRRAFRPVLWDVKVDESPRRIFIGERAVSFDAPDDFDPVAGQTAALQAERAKLVAEFTAKLRGIDEQLANLQAITHEVSA